MDNSELDDLDLRKMTSYDSGELFFTISRELKPSISRELKPSTSGRAGGSKVLEVLNTIGSRLSSLNSLSQVVSITASTRNKVSMLAFEVANTIVKGSNLMQSLSKENIQIFEKEILHSKGVQLLVSTDMKKLLSIAAADKREELKVFTRDVVRFGNMCIDPQWHHLDRFLESLCLVGGTNKQPQKEAEITMQKMTNLAKHTSELYHELEALDILHKLYRRRLEEVQSLHLLRKGERELKHQRKLVRKLKKKSLWHLNLEEVVEKLVDVAFFIHQKISKAFKENATRSKVNGREANKEPETLGVAGLALHYANLIMLMNCIASRPTCLIPNMRNTLYNNLPASVKSALRSSLQALDSPEVMTMPQIKAEMDKTLNWLVPLATDTIKHRAQQGFGFVGEWANTGNEFGSKTAGSNNVIQLQTLYHADKQKMDLYVLDLIILLHRLISLTRYKDDVSKGLNLHPDGKLKMIQISSEDKNLLEKN